MIKPKWIRFKRLMERLGLDEYELHQIIEQRHIDPYVDYYCNQNYLPDMPIHPFRIDSLQTEQDISNDK
jgi:hypothetical protein